MKKILAQNFFSAGLVFGNKIQSYQLFVDA
jgi:hypothetical protein